MDVVQPPAPWLSKSLDLLSKSRGRRPLIHGAEGLASRLLRSIEADDIPVPAMWADRNGGLIMDWESARGKLTVEVHGADRFRWTWSNAEAHRPWRLVYKDWAWEIRVAIGWVFDVNRGGEDVFD